MDEDQADDLFRVATLAIEGAEELKNLKPWYRADELGHRQMVWTHEGGGRKIVTPIVEKAVINWEMHQDRAV